MEETQPRQQSTSSDTPSGEVPDIQVITEGDEAARCVGYALRRLRPVLVRLAEPVVSCRLKLLEAPNPAQPRRARARVVIDVDGDLVRAEVAAETMPAAVDMLKDRLRDQLQHRSERRKAWRRSLPAPLAGVWHRDDLPGHRPLYYQRPVSDRQLIRRKVVSLGTATAGQAAADMEQLDFDFFLFRDHFTGQEALVYEEEDGSYRLVQLHPMAGRLAKEAGLRLADLVPSRLTVTEAVERLGISGERFLFFENAETGRGNVLYRRYDGHYGLLTPA